MNPDAPLTPFAMPQYKLAAAAEARRLDAAAEVSAAEVRRDIQRGSNYVLGVVLFSVSLFFAGLSPGSPTCGSGRSRSRSAASSFSAR